MVGAIPAASTEPVAIGVGDVYIARNPEREVIMKITLTALLICFVSTSLLGQTPYPIPADSKGNQIILTVANESKTTAAQKLQVQVQNASSAIVFSRSSASVTTIPIGKGV